MLCSGGSYNVDCREYGLNHIKDMMRPSTNIKASLGKIYYSNNLQQMDQSGLDLRITTDVLIRPGPKNYNKWAH